MVNVTGVTGRASTSFSSAMSPCRTMVSSVSSRSSSTAFRSKVWLPRVCPALITISKGAMASKSDASAALASRESLSTDTRTVISVSSGSESSGSNRAVTVTVISSPSCTVSRLTLRVMAVERTSSSSAMVPVAVSAL